MASSPNKRNVLVAATMVFFRGVVYTGGFLVGLIGTIGGGGKTHSHNLVVEPTIGVSTAHADAPVASCDSCSSCDSCGCGGCEG